MDDVLFQQSPMNQRGSHTVVKYSSRSYGRILFRSPNSPPPSSSPSPELGHLFRGSKAGDLVITDLLPHPTSPASPLPALHQPPLLPSPCSPKLPLRSVEQPVGSGLKKLSKRTAPKASSLMRKEDAKKAASPPMKPTAAEMPAIIGRDNNIQGEDRLLVELVYSLSPPPSCLPLPRFSLTRPKAGGKGPEAAGSCTAQAVA
ncbi:hypothetical protein AXF42_Ash016188 [Apostasia shenzhenica]|uniref:Uncharacterized protein n=1 Tax=Apostasia shenzhenica TaxID=1088818 RepID=A0A2I0AER3_9ASPA|nr:hypothetical protein AXF42_Ash016188 [Apostasia shenzhenica]